MPKSKTSALDSKSGASVDLEFPDGSGFVGKKLPIHWPQMIALSEERLPFLNRLPHREKQRLDAKCRIPFVLLDS